jgi:hypothetical protein
MSRVRLILFLPVILLAGIVCGIVGMFRVPEED